MTRPDVLVVGGGPVGLAVAIRARMEGMSVRLVEAGSPPMDKACGEGLMPDAAGLLEDLGVELKQLEYKTFFGIRYVSDAVTVDGRFPGPPGYGVRRTELHRALAERAAEVGVKLHWSTPVSGFTPAGVQGDSGELQARWIVAADGLRSTLRRAAGLEGREPRWKRFGARRHYRVEPWTDLVEVHWGEDCEAYITPVGPDLVGVAILWSGERRSWDRMLAGFPAIREKLSGAGTASPERGAGPLAQRVRAVTRGNLALVGDASGYLDAITGEGLAVGFRQAFAVVKAMAEGDLSIYGAEHRRIMRVPNAMTRLLLWAEQRPDLRNRFLWTLRENPGLLDRLLAILTGSLPPSRLGARNAIRLFRPLLG